MEGIDFGWIMGAMASRARSQAPHAGGELRERGRELGKMVQTLVQSPGGRRLPI